MTLNIKTKKKSIISIALLLVFVTALISSGCQNDSKNIGNFAFTKENYPKMGGSLANQPLGEAVTATVLGISREEAANMIVFENSTTANYNSLRCV